MFASDGNATSTPTPLYVDTHRHWHVPDLPVIVNPNEHVNELAVQGSETKCGYLGN